MRKFFGALALLLGLLAWPLLAMAADDCRVFVEGIEISIAEMHDGCVCVSADCLLGVLGYDVYSNASWSFMGKDVPTVPGQLTARKEGRPTVTLNLDESTAHFNGWQTWEMPTAAYESHGSVEGFFLVPVRLLEQESFGCTVEWLPEKQQVQVKLKEPPAVIYPFADLTAEQLAGVEVHYKTGLSTRLNEEEKAKMLDFLHNLAYYDMPLKGLILEVVGGLTNKFDLIFADGSRRDLGTLSCAEYSAWVFYDNVKDSFVETLLSDDLTIQYYPAVDEEFFRNFNSFYDELNHKYNPVYNSEK